MDGVLIWGTVGTSGTSGTSSLSRRGVEAPNPKTFALKFVKESLLRLSLRQVICAQLNSNPALR